MTPNPNETDLHAINILIESAAPEREAPAVVNRVLFRGILRDREMWRETAELVTAERERWRRVALAWPWAAAGLVFGWGVTVWGWLGR